MASLRTEDTRASGSTNSTCLASISWTGRWCVDYGSSGAGADCQSNCRDGRSSGIYSRPSLEQYDRLRFLEGRANRRKNRIACQGLISSQCCLFLGGSCVTFPARRPKATLRERLRLWVASVVLSPPVRCQDLWLQPDSIGR